MVNCLIVDDDIIASTVIKHFVDNTEGLTVIDVLTDGIQASNYIRKHEGEIDLIFLDIELPGMNGMELLESNKNLPPVILVTSKEKYAAAAFNFKVVHYLVKPVEYSKFLSAIDRVMQTSTQAEKDLNEAIFIKENGVLSKIMRNEILYIEALGDYVKIHLKGKVHTINSTMKNFEDKLKQHRQFIRVHRSYLINLDFLENFDNETAIVAGKIIPIGAKFKPLLQSRLNII
jgi:two-component system, LytTR family, response regulator LytT